MGFVCGRVTRIVTDDARILRAGCARHCVVVAYECCVSRSKLCKAVSCLITCDTRVGPNMADVSVTATCRLSQSFKVRAKATRELAILFGMPSTQCYALGVGAVDTEFDAGAVVVRVQLVLHCTQQCGQFGRVIRSSRGTIVLSISWHGGYTSTTCTNEFFRGAHRQLLQ